MSYLQRFEQDRRQFRPEGFLILTRSGLLVYGSVVGTTATVETLSSPSQKGELSTPVLGEWMARVRARSLRRASVRVLLPRGSEGEASESLRGGVRLHDSASEGVKLVLLWATARCRRGSSSTATSRGRQAFEYPWRMAVTTLGLMVLAGANDRLSRYLGLEWSSLGLYVLASIRRGSAYSTEAGLKYFMMGAVASGRYLFGASRIYGWTGSLQRGERSRRGRGRADDSDTLGISVGRSLGSRRVRTAFLFKLAVAPFHAWSPDVYEGSPSPSSLYFAVVPKRAMARVVLRLVYGGRAPRFGRLQGVRRGASLASRTVAALGARAQRRWKRFRAYSSIGHMGYLRLGIASGSVEGVQAARVYRRIYVVMSINVWLGVMSVRWSSPSGGWVSAKYRTDRAGLGQAQPVLAASLALSVRSMAGIPPRAGFLAKRWVFLSAVSQSLWVFSGLAVLASCVGALYYLRWVKRMYFEGSHPSQGEWAPVDEGSSWVRGRTSGLLRRVLRVPGPLRVRTHRMARSLC